MFKLIRLLTPCCYDRVYGTDDAACIDRELMQYITFILSLGNNTLKAVIVSRELHLFRKGTALGLAAGNVGDPVAVAGHTSVRS